MQSQEQQWNWAQLTLSFYFSSFHFYTLCFCLCKYLSSWWKFPLFTSLIHLFSHWPVLLHKQCRSKDWRVLNLSVEGGKGRRLTIWRACRICPNMLWRAEWINPCQCGHSCSSCGLFPSLPKNDWMWMLSLEVCIMRTSMAELYQITHHVVNGHSFSLMLS